MEQSSGSKLASFYANHKVLLWLLLLLVQQIALLVFMNGTGDDGDSISHYLDNHYAFEYSWLFVNSWSKPLYVLFSSGFAQLGFWGIKLFNSLMAIGAAFLSYKLAKKIELPNPELAMPLLMFMPDYLCLSLSGLTEPLFSFLAVAALLCLAYEKHWIGAIIISFLPFARPEGLFFIGLGGLYFLLHKNWWKYIPALLTGHVFYTFLGVLFFDQSWLWVFSSNPNAVITPAYGVKGDWLHYVRNLLHVQGLPIYIFFWIGFLVSGWRLVKEWKAFRKQPIFAFVFAAIFTVVLAHTVFWKFGLFKSFGLTRNLLTVAPLMAIVALVGINVFWRSVMNYFKKRSGVGIALSMLYIIIFCYSWSKYAAGFPQKFQLNPVQEMAAEVAMLVEEEYADMQMSYYYYPYISMLLNQDPFDSNQHKTLFKALFDQPISQNTVVIWDDWYAVMEGKVTFEMLQQHPELEEVRSFETNDHTGGKRTMVVFKSKNWE